MTDEYRHAVALYNELVNLERAIEVEERCLRHACWHHCLATYASLAHCPDPAGAAKRLGVAYEVGNPATIWAALFTDEEPPGEYPPGDRENWIDAVATPRSAQPTAL